MGAESLTVHFCTNLVRTLSRPLVVTRIARLARSMRDLQVMVATLKDKGAHLAATEQPVDTSTSSISRCDTAGSFT